MWNTRTLRLLSWLLLLMAGTALAQSERAPERSQMVLQLQEYGSGETRVTDKQVLDAMRRVPRHLFVPDSRAAAAYDDRPLPIGMGQTISQPYIVALMTQLAQVSTGMKVLEVGTGSGYQAAVLAELTDKVYSIEIITPLAVAASARFQHLGLHRITSREGDGYYGWEEHAPFDRILVTAAARHIPPPLLEQLQPGGRMVIPVGPKWGSQRLLLVLKDEAGEVTTRSLLPVVFVPLTGGR